jgi:hypothetical protein
MMITQGDDVVVHVDGHWLRRYATDFLSAAQTFEPPKNRFSPVPYYLICHSIELSLKAFLFSAGFKKKERKELSHNLEKALDEAEHKGLSTHLEITSNDREALKKANKLYSIKEFEYFEKLETIYDPHDFDLDALASFAQRLLDAIEAPVSASIFE